MEAPRVLSEGWSINKQGNQQANLCSKPTELCPAAPAKPREREERHVLLILHIFPKSFADSYIVIVLTDMPN